MQGRFQLEEGWSTLLILWAMVLTAAMAIIQADLIGGLHIITFVASFAILAGLMLSKSRFSANVSHFFALIYGLFVIFYLVGNTLPEEMLWRERVFDLVTRQTTWFRKAFSGGTSRDGLIFVIQTSAVFWLLGYTSAWYTFRKPRIWFAIVPTGIVLLSVVYYYIGPKRLTLYVAAYVVLALLLVARTHLVSQEKMWRSAGVRFERNIWMTFLRAGFLASLVALILAWSMPAMAASTVVSDALSGTRGPWRDFQDNWTRLFSALRAYGTDTRDPYNDILVLGGPRTVGSTPIMDIYVPRQLPYVYWQAIVYDRYEDGGWFTADTESTLHFPDDGRIKIPPTSARTVVTQTVVNYLPNSSFIYGAPEIVGSSRQMFVEATTDEDGNNLVSSVRSRFVLQQGTHYDVASSVSTVDEESLRNASTNYPERVTDTYLQVPDTITPETLRLAEELSAGQPTPFDTAIAVRDYLRENISYNDQIAAPPEGVDPVHHTLFVTQEGYCNYYASAMAMMLRSQGIPTRVVSGYAQGEYNEDNLSYRVRASNAHTWVEVYFPQYGWIEFEPTASIPTVARPETAGSGGDRFASGNPLPPEIPYEELLPEDDFRDLERGGDLPLELPDRSFGARVRLFISSMSTWQLVGASLTILLSLVAIVLAIEVNRRIEADVERSYVRLGNWARWLGIHVRPAHTPYERADLMATALPEGKAPIRNLSRQYVLKQFGRDRSVEPGFDSTQEWRSLRPMFLKQAILKRLQRLQKRDPLRS